MVGTLISVIRVPGGYTRAGPTRLTGRIRAKKMGTRVPAGNWYSRLILPVQSLETLLNTHSHTRTSHMPPTFNYTKH